MFNKKTLVDQSIYTTITPKVLAVNFDKLNINILENYYYKNKLNPNQYSYLKAARAEARVIRYVGIAFIIFFMELIWLSI